MRFLFLLFLLFPFILNAQVILPIKSEERNKIDEKSNNEYLHTFFGAIVISEDEKASCDSLLYHSYRNRGQANWFVQKLFYEDFISIQDTGYNLIINPLFNFTSSNVRKYNQLTINERGAEVKGTIGQKIYFSTLFLENQHFFRSHLKRYTMQHVAIPGYGVPKRFKETGQDFTKSQGIISYSPARWINLQIGHGQFFLGNGFRSLILSDNAISYPYLKTLFEYKKIQYQIAFSEYTNFDLDHWGYSSGEISYRYRKYASLIAFSYLPFEGTEFSFFEHILWQTSDYKTYSRKIPLNYFNPLPLWRPIQYGMDSKHNALIGFNFRQRIYTPLQVYGQLIFDNISKNKPDSTHAGNRYGWQIGFKYFDLLHSFIDNTQIYFQTELNYVSPHTYSHTNARQSYTHYNLPLAHLWGANFFENIVIIKARYRHFFVEYKWTRLHSGVDTKDTNYGKNIWTSDANAHLFYDDKNNFPNIQGYERTIFHNSIIAGYTFNYRYNFQLFGGIDNRTVQVKTKKTNDKYIFFGLKTNIHSTFNTEL